jgi:glycosyltransferase involved in cell wall biosynthesis
MKISIITVCFNSAKTISDTIRSVANQEYPDIEHIIVDGGSTDGTVKLIDNASSIARYVSEPDKGIYDAMNKGIAMATGDVVGILNADDFYTSNHVVSSIAKVFENPTIDACYADLVYVDQNDTNKVVRYWRSEVFISGAFKRGWMPPHPTFFCRKSVYEENGNFDLNYKIASDVELLFRFLEDKKIRCMYLPELIIKMRLGGTTNKNLKNIIFQNREVLRFLDDYYGRVSRLHFFYCKISNRLKQFIFKPKD